MDRYLELQTTFEKRLVASSAQDPGFARALEAMAFARSVHTGWRKDGRTPEFAHPLKVATRVLALPGQIADRPDAVATALLHDTVEDHDVHFLDIERRFGLNVARAVQRLTKSGEDNAHSDTRYFSEIARCPMASIVKGCDRIDNVGTMSGVFDKNKQVSYLAHSEQHVLPMIRTARALFFGQRVAYAVIEAALRLRIRDVRSTHQRAA